MKLGWPDTCLIDMNVSGGEEILQFIAKWTATLALSKSIENFAMARQEPSSAIRMFLK